MRRKTAKRTPIGSGHQHNRASVTPDYLKDYAAENRERATPAHRYLVGCLKKMDLGFRIYTEHGVTAGGRDMLLDIYFPDLMLAIEVDGGSHNGKEFDDASRDLTLRTLLGIETLRCRNAEVFYKLSDLLPRIAHTIKTRAQQMGRLHSR